MRSNNIKLRWSQGQATVNGWLSIPSSVSAEIMAHQGWDSLTIDLQHGLVDYQTALTMLQAVSIKDATPLARVPWLEAGIIMKLLDAGAYGIICPMINTPEEAQRFVSYCRYAPLGQRSFGPTRAVFYAGADYAQHANDTILTLAMIETRQALDNVAAIAATPGLDGLYIGPSDLSLSMGYTPKLDQEEPAVLEAIEAIRKAAKDAGISVGIHCLEPSYAQRMIDQGFDMVTIGSDIRLLGAAAAAAVKATKAKG